MAQGSRPYDGKVDWGEWAAEDRTQLQVGAMSDADKAAVQDAGKAEGRCDEDPAFDTTIAGPWMRNWDLIHHNRHTAALEDTTTINFEVVGVQQ